MSMLAIDEKDIGPQATGPELSGTQHRENLEDIDHVVENVRVRVSTSVVRTQHDNIRAMDDVALTCRTI